MHQVLNLATVRLLQQLKIADIEWLKEVQRIRRHIESNDVVLLIIELEFSRVVALVAVEDQQLVFAFYTRCYIDIEMLDPIQAYYISSLAVISSCDTLVSREVALGILVGEVALCG